MTTLRPGTWTATIPRSAARAFAASTAACEESLKSRSKDGAPLSNHASTASTAARASASEAATWSGPTKWPAPGRRTTRAPCRTRPVDGEVAGLRRRLDGGIACILRPTRGRGLVGDGCEVRRDRLNRLRLRPCDQRATMEVGRPIDEPRGTRTRGPARTCRGPTGPRFETRGSPTQAASTGRRILLEQVGDARGETSSVACKVNVSRESVGVEVHTASVSRTSALRPGALHFVPTTPLILSSIARSILRCTACFA